MSRYIFVPFDRDLAPKWVSSKNQEWRTVKDTSIKHAGLDEPLKNVKDGDTIYVQAEGFTNNVHRIGGPGGQPSLKPAEVLSALQDAGVKPGTPNLKIKIWACFSGFAFAEEFYNSAVQVYPRLRVDGYLGATRLGSPKKVKPAVSDGRRGVTNSWNDADEVDAQDQRVSFPRT